MGRPVATLAASSAGGAGALTRAQRLAILELPIVESARDRCRHSPIIGAMTDLPILISIRISDRIPAARRRALHGLTEVVSTYR
ncbi:hypothetical protein [Paenibacillus harenae]|uniref:hypothetical protein n=1 Tax=Paenibacillus harenae TaxID=306543 RepID=UPI0012EC2DA0|nr:hypothetical protein [Paenibacillus harenae]